MGIVFAVITFIGDGFQTIVSNSRPSKINPLVFSWITACIELMFIFPFFCFSLWKRKQRKKFQKQNKGVQHHPSDGEKSLTLSKKQKIFRLSLAGFIFAGCAYYLIVGFSMVDSVTGILAIKTQPISMLIIGVVFLKEKLSWKESVIGVGMFVLIIFITTKGSFDIGNLSPGVLYLLVVPIFWNVGHSLAKPFLSDGLLSIPEFVFIRIAFTSIILGVVFLIVGDVDDLSVLMSRDALVSIFSMGFLFSLLHTCWYQAVRALPLTLTTLIVIPSPVVTAILSYFITQEPLYYYHYVGIVGEIIGLSSLILIQTQSKKKKEDISHEEVLETAV